MKTKTISVEAATSQQRVEDAQCDYSYKHDTVAEAKRDARRVLTDDYQRSVEASEPLWYARVMVDGDCVADFFRR